MARKQTHDDFDPDEFDDESSEELDLDVEDSGSSRVQRDTGFCPECGAEIYDAADICPKCFAWIDGETTRHDPKRRRAAQRWNLLVVWAVIGAIATGLGFFALTGLFR
ncbi:MAG: hypothetical protein RIT24_2733 [Planctomycetota bacterium]|jgi:hypothetical protein